MTTNALKSAARAEFLAKLYMANPMATPKTAIKINESTTGASRASEGNIRNGKAYATYADTIGDMKYSEIFSISLVWNNHATNLPTAIRMA